MKKLLSTLYFSLSFLIGIAQTITFNFQGEDIQSSNYIALQSVFIQNLTAECDTTIFGPDPSVTLDYLTGINEYSFAKVNPFEVISTCPNPFVGSTFVTINLNIDRNLHLSLINLQGTVFANFSKELNIGSHMFEISSFNHNLYILIVSDGTFSQSIKLLNRASGIEKENIRYAGSAVGKFHNTYKAIEVNGFTFHLGDQLLYTATALGYEEDTIADDPIQSTDYTFEMTALPLTDGYYIKGSTTPCPELNLNGLMSIARNEVNNYQYNNGSIPEDDRPELKEIYMAVEGGGTGFNIVKVNGSLTITYGPGPDFELVPEYELDPEEPKAGLWRGSMVETDDKFIMLEDGLYHIAFDEEIMIVVVTKVEWGVCGGATPSGWALSTVLPSGAFDLYAMKFEIDSIVMLENEWKFRYSNGWKVVIDPYFPTGGSNNGIKVNANFGGQVDDLVSGGYNIVNDEYAVYEITMNWELGVGHTASFVWIDEAEPLPVYPDTMYIVGDGTAYGWNTPGTIPDAVMHKCAGGLLMEGIFWKICHLDADQGFKFSDSDWGPYNFGYYEIDVFDPDGVDVYEMDGNMAIADSGMYMIVLNLQDSLVQLSIKVAEVYGIGDTFGGWDEDIPDNLFSIDNVTKTLTSPTLVSDGNIRMYAQHTWISDWWNAEFNVFDTTIVYRNDGGDQDPVPGITGQVITLHFDDNTGSIE